MFTPSVDSFIEHLKVVKAASEHTLRNYTIDLNALSTFLDPLNAGLALSTINRKTLRDFLAHEMKNGAAKRTLARRLSTLRTFFKWATAKRRIAINPAEELETPKLEKKIPTYLTFEQVERLFSQPDTDCLLGIRDRAILELFYSSGLRVSELVTLNKEDFNPKERLLRVKGKGKKERIVPITKNASEKILVYLSHKEREEKDSKAIFLNHLGGRLTSRSVDRNFQKYLKNSGLAGTITPHTIRHTIATHWLENGMDLKTIQTLLGHSCLATTTIYTEVNTTLKKKAYNQAHPRA